MSSVTAMPTPDQLREYTGNLPPIYKLVLVTIQSTNPDRLYGEGVFAAAIRDRFQRLAHDEDELRLALDKLEDAGFLHYNDLIGMYVPTALGEELLATVSGKRAKKVHVPDLPKPTW